MSANIVSDDKSPKHMRLSTDEGAPKPVKPDPASQTKAEEPIVPSRPPKKSWFAGYEREFESAFSMFLLCLWTVLPASLMAGAISGYIVTAAMIGVILTVVGCIWAWYKPS